MLPIRTMMVGGGLGRFTRTIDILASAAMVNLRTLANAAGYLGDRPAVLTLNLAPGVQLDAGLTFGIWPDFGHSMTLNVAGNIHGMGGLGGEGGDGMGGYSGGAGGDAIYCTVDAQINVAGTANIKGGGGGGGGGGGSSRWAGSFGEEEFQSQVDGPGNGGAGGVNPASDGIAGAAGAAPTGGTYPWTNWPAGSGGLGGYAIRMNGKAVVINNAGGTIIGLQA